MEGWRQTEEGGWKDRQEERERCKSGMSERGRGGGEEYSGKKEKGRWSKNRLKKRRN